MSTSAKEMERYSCPYCSHDSVSPGGVKFHVRIHHSDKLEEFLQKYYPEMEKKFQREIEA